MSEREHLSREFQHSIKSDKARASILQELRIVSFMQNSTSNPDNSQRSARMPLADKETAYPTLRSPSLEAPMKVSTSATCTHFPALFGDMDLGMPVLSRSLSVVDIAALP